MEKNTWVSEIYVIIIIQVKIKKNKLKVAQYNIPTIREVGWSYGNAEE
jgi:hypothetical protein